ncbi:TetR/AcrR family transcriptional regulator [uncultured Bacteroides sp.]|uniref:TetR/AcrR family transcriptional regulator n=1 Tax=uncultured Bacteroides sp. TaxID=162156 RepID=UPI002AAB15E7|nr:TetR/AcrR family transcriptional regulator [uncultured Bacteroides sp.]
MQRQKDDIRKVILKIARKEFIEKGFKDTSMRTIAQKTEVGLSNIYNYFKNKDEIFHEVLASAIRAFEKVMKDHNNVEFINIDIFSSDEYLRTQVEMFFNLITNYKADMNLLFFKSSGSALENYREELIEQYTQMGIEYIAIMKSKYPKINGNISPFFIHTMSAWLMSCITELVMHDLSDDEMETFIREYMEFGTAGWQKLMRV